jgi:adenylate kinase
MRHFNNSKLKTQNSKLKSQKSKVIILMGPPGSGKGTQAILLSEKFNLYYFETSKILEEKFALAKRGEKIEVEGKKYSILKEKERWLKGELCSPPFVTFLVKEKIEQLFKEGKNLILAGSPRTVYEAERIMPQIEKLYGKKNIKIFLLEISPKETLQRNSQRKICELMRHPIIFSPQTKNLKICPLDGSRLIKRKGLDDPKTIIKRIEAYQKETLPVIEYFKKQKYKVIKINGSPPPAQVFNDILKHLK